MIHLTVVHWIMAIIFLLIFVLLILLSLRESEKKTRVILMVTSFVISIVGLIFGFLILDKYTKKAKILSYSTVRNYNKESVTILGKIKNVGKFHIAYCTLDVKIVNKPKHKTKRIMYQTSSLSDFFKGSNYKKSYITDSKKVVEDIKPKFSKDFKMQTKLPSHFDNPRYFLHIVCH